MFCNKKQCEKCGLGVKLTLQNKETQEIKESHGCIMMEIYLQLRQLNDSHTAMRQDMQSRGNELVKGLAHNVMTNLKGIRQ